MRHVLPGFFFLALMLGAGAGAAPTVDKLPPEAGLVRVPSPTFDELYRRPGAELSAYRRVLIEAVPAQFDAGWLRRMNDSRGVTRWIEPADADEILGRMSRAMRDAMRQALVARGYEAVDEATPGTLRLSPAIERLFVNAPFVPGPGIDIGIVHRDAGEATMRLDIVDAVTGTRLARIVDRDTARTIGGYEKATSVSNLFWFEAMFRRWADDCAREIVALAAPH